MTWSHMASFSNDFQAFSLHIWYYVRETDVRRLTYQWYVVGDCPEDMTTRYWVTTPRLWQNDCMVVDCPEDMITRYGVTTPRLWQNDCMVVDCPKELTHCGQLSQRSDIWHMVGDCPKDLTHCRWLSQGSDTNVVDDCHKAVTPIYYMWLSQGAYNNVCWVALRDLT